MKTSTTTTPGLRVKTSIKAGGFGSNHAVALVTTTPGLRVKTSIKAGGFGSNHSVALVTSR